MQLKISPLRNTIVSAIEFFCDLYRHKNMIFSLTLRDFKGRYAGSLLGILWAFLQPLTMMMILWFVFTVGLKAGSPRNNIPFVAWFFTAMIAWNFFADALLISSNALSEYSFLVKKVKFQIALLPLIKIFSSVILHSVFILLLMVVLIFNGIFPNFYWAQSIYYLAGTLVLLTGLGWITSSLSVFLKDTGQIVGIIIQFGFWATPVIWDPSSVSAKYSRLIKLNPMYYIVDGYRESFLYRKAIWESSPYLIFYFWIVALTIFFFGYFLFRKLRPHFADVL